MVGGWQSTATCVVATVPVMGRVADHGIDAGELPPLAPVTAGDDERARAIEARMIARRGRAPRLEDFRRSYAACGMDWPGDDEVRRRHPVRD